MQSAHRLVHVKNQDELTYLHVLFLYKNENGLEPTILSMPDGYGH